MFVFGNVRVNTFMNQQKNLAIEASGTYLITTGILQLRKKIKINKSVPCVFMNIHTRSTFKQPTN